MKKQRHQKMKPFEIKPHSSVSLHFLNLFFLGGGYFYGVEILKNSIYEAKGIYVDGVRTKINKKEDNF